MNLEFDRDVEDMLDVATDVFKKVAPVSRFRSDPGVWADVAAAGWGSIGADFMMGSVDLGTAAAIARVAGRQLLIEQFVTSGFLVPALLVGASGPDADDLRRRLTVRPAVLVGDGAVSETGTERGLCFGLEGDEHEFVRLAGEESPLLLEFVEGADIHIDRVADLSYATGRVEIRGGTWRQVELAGPATRVADLHQCARLLHAAALLGCADETLRITRDYTLERIQFDVPIASFQAIKHGLADVLAAIEVAWGAILCACADDAADQLRFDVARSLCLDAAHVAAVAGAQFHGGIGFTWECDLHFFLKAMLDGSLRFESREELAAAVANQFVELATC